MPVRPSSHSLLLLVYPGVKVGPESMPPALLSTPPMDRGIQGLSSYISRVHRPFLLIRNFHLRTFGFCVRLSSKLALSTHACI